MKYSTLIISALLISSSVAIKCYRGIANNVIKESLEFEEGTCIRYRLACAANDNACTPDEQAAGIAKTAYIVGNAQVVNSMNSLKGVVGNPYMDVFICNTDFCNAPVDEISPTTSTAIAQSTSGVKQTDAVKPSSGFNKTCMPGMALGLICILFF